MYENHTWEQISQIIRDLTVELGHAPGKGDVASSEELIAGFYGGWPFVLSYSGIYPRAGDKRKSRYPMLLKDFTDEDIISIVRMVAWKFRRTPLEKDTWLYPEIINRWKTWPAAMEVCGMRLPDYYKPRTPVSFRVPKNGLPTWRQELIHDARRQPRIPSHPRTTVWRAPGV